MAKYTDEEKEAIKKRAEALPRTADDLTVIDKIVAMISERVPHLGTPLLARCGCAAMPFPAASALKLVIKTAKMCFPCHEINSQTCVRVRERHTHTQRERETVCVCARERDTRTQREKERACVRARERERKYKLTPACYRYMLGTGIKTEKQHFQTLIDTHIKLRRGWIEQFGCFPEDPCDTAAGPGNSSTSASDDP